MINDDIRKAAMDEIKAITDALWETESQEIQNGCKQIFALYTGFIKAGFTSDQAMQLLSNMLSAAFGAFGKADDK